MQLFGHILRDEEKAMARYVDNLSMKETHVLEVVDRGCENYQNSMSELARALGITVGSLTVAIAVLRRKGYVERHHDQVDRRSVRIYLTERGAEVVRYHTEFHRAMVAAIADHLTPDELQLLTESLRKIDRYFAGGTERE